MASILDPKTAELANLCRRYKVRRLELFGSASGERFDPIRSDIDFLVEFNRIESVGAADQYFGLLEALEGLFQRPIDLVEIAAMRNPFFLRGIAASRKVVYAA